MVGQEIRNCVYHGEFNNLLCKLNEYGNWRKIFGSITSHKRQKDVELILRFFSFYENGENYERPIKDFMSNFMCANQHLAQDKALHFEKIFKETCDKVVLKLGEKPFHIWSGLNVAVFDSTFTTLAKYGIHDDISARFEALKNDEDFIKGVRGATADDSVVTLRMKLAKQYLVE